MDSVNVDGVLLRRVSPFGNLRIKAYLRLPEAYRSLSRPSSALSAKAFPLRPLQLDLVLVGCLNVLKLDLSHLFQDFFVPFHFGTLRGASSTLRYCIARIRKNLGSRNFL